jgi:hypothetical protein
MLKTNHTYVLLSVVTALAVLVLSAGALSFAQTTALTCTPTSSSVSRNQSVTLTANGGTGSYVWSGTNLNVTNATGKQFTVTYPNAGTYTITVTSGGQSASCTVAVTSGTGGGSLSCLPAVQTVTLGQTAQVNASGGAGTYTWSAPGLTVNNATGSGFNANYATLGTKTITVTSGGASADCMVNVVAATGGGTTAPGLPDTGGGYGQW